MRTEILTFEGPLEVVDLLSDTPTVELLNNCLRRYSKRLMAVSQSSANTYSERGRLHYEIGKLHDQLTRWADAEMHYRAAVHAFKQLGDVSCQVAQTHLLLGEVQAYLYPSDQAAEENIEAAFQNALTLGKDLDNAWLQARALYNMGQLSAFSGDYENALTRYQAAEKLMDEAGSQTDCLANELLRAEIAYSRNLVQTEQAVDEADDLARKLLGLHSLSFELQTRSTVSSGGSRPWWQRWRRRK
ncbi:MAG: hypothetical protein WBD47_19530 [Phormidesmis sp.]